MLVVENNNFEDSSKDRNQPLGLSFALFAREIERREIDTTFGN